MSKESVYSYLKRLSQDQLFQQKVLLSSKPEERLQLMQTEGYEFTEFEYSEVINQLSLEMHQKFSKEELIELVKHIQLEIINNNLLISEKYQADEDFKNVLDEESLQIAVGGLSFWWEAPVDEIARMLIEAYKVLRDTKKSFYY